MRDLREDLVRAAEETAYTLVGLGVLGIQRVQVLRRQITAPGGPIEFVTGLLSPHPQDPEPPTEE